MNLKCVLALLLALWMMVSLFSACTSEDKSEDKKDEATASDKTDNKGKDKTDAPDETERLALEWMESQTAFVGFSFSTECDYAAAAKRMDFLVDQDVFMIFKYGIEGKA